MYSLISECLGTAFLGGSLLKYCPLFSDDRFPDYGKVELVFSGTPEKIQGEYTEKNMLSLKIN